MSCNYNHCYVYTIFLVSYYDVSYQLCSFSVTGLKHSPSSCFCSWSPGGCRSAYKLCSWHTSEEQGGYHWALVSITFQALIHVMVLSWCHIRAILKVYFIAVWHCIYFKVGPINLFCSWPDQELCVNKCWSGVLKCDYNSVHWEVLGQGETEDTM